MSESDKQKQQKTRRGCGCLTILALVAVAAVWLWSTNAADENVITQADLGPDWPFVDGVTEITLHCEPANVVVIEHDGVRYAVNGLARAAYPEYPLPQDAGIVRVDEIADGVEANADAVTPFVRLCGLMESN